MEKIRRRVAKTTGYIMYLSSLGDPWYLGDGTIGGIILYSEVINQHKKLREGIDTERDSPDRQEST